VLVTPSFDTVARPTSGDGLWMYFVAGLPAAQPFTAAAADAAFAARPPFSGSCT
jgi:hypothetical protein